LYRRIKTKFISEQRHGHRFIACTISCSLIALKSIGNQPHYIVTSNPESFLPPTSLVMAESSLKTSTLIYVTNLKRLKCEESIDSSCTASICAAAWIPSTGMYIKKCLSWCISKRQISYESIQRCKYCTFPMDIQFKQK
jgi:hypothetical protein